MFQLAEISMQREQKTLDLKCKLENYDSTQLPLEMELSYRLQIQMKICNIPASEITDLRILGMVCFKNLIQSLHNNLNEIF